MRGRSRRYAISANSGGRPRAVFSGGFGGRLTTDQAFVLYVDSLRSGAHQREAYHALIHYELIEKLPRIAVPTLLLTGEHSTREEPSGYM